MSYLKVWWGIWFGVDNGVFWGINGYVKKFVLLGNIRYGIFLFKLKMWIWKKEYFILVS